MKKKTVKKAASKRRVVQKKKSKPVKKAKAASARTRVAKKPAPKKKPAKKTPAAKKTPVNTRTRERRRLISMERALVRDVENEPTKTSMSDSPEYIPEAMEDSLAEELGEAAVASETSGDQEAENIRDEDLDEDEGGPFVETSARQEFASGTDESNPEDAEPEGFPTPNARRR